MAPLVILATAIMALSAVCYAVTDKQVNDFLNVCIDSKHHKEKPGPEVDYFHHCTPWIDHACCKSNTTKHIESDGTITLYRMRWDQCPQKRAMSAKCKRFFEMDTCFYECSPYLRPWIEVDPHSKVTRRERFTNVPLCSSDCDAWFEACKFDYTCSNNWGDMETWNWTKNGNDCKMECKTFKDYFGSPANFCNRLFNYSFKYTSGKAGEDCMVLWPNGTNSRLNSQVARKYARKELSVSQSDVLRPRFAIVILAFLLFAQL
ncbi:folate receptor gamma [Nematostella vectensis]|uniref:folate receptor gamma n=1 Tax=Nematostella vectensis TaxID=45351 RepID=UPI00207754D3|nr:folate receptor gamma [Nematostella vectensis]